MRPIKDLFKTSIEEPEEIGIEQQIIISNRVREMLEHEGFFYVEKQVSEIVAYLNQQIANTKDPMEIKQHQGEIRGIVALRRAISDILQAGDAANDELKAKRKEEEPSQN